MKLQNILQEQQSFRTLKDYVPPLFIKDEYKEEILKQYKEDRIWQTTFMANGIGLYSLEGGPKIVDGDFRVANNNLSSLKFAPKIVKGHVILTNNRLFTLKDIHKDIEEMNGTLFLELNPIESHVLGILMIKGVAEVRFTQRSTMHGTDTVEKHKINEKLDEILNRHLKGNRDIFECQQELIDAGLKEYAKL